MAAPRDIEELLGQIRATRSPVKRMRLLARGWRLLRHLNPLERRRLVAKLGIERFEEVLDKLGYGDAAIEPEELDLILDKVGEVDPGKVRHLISDLKDPVRRKEMARQGFEALKQRLQEPVPAKTGPRPAEPPGNVPDAKAAGRSATGPLSSPRAAREGPAARAPAPATAAAPVRPSGPEPPKPARAPLPPRPVPPPKAPVAAAAPRAVVRAPVPAPVPAPHIALRPRPRAASPPRATKRRGPPDRAMDLAVELAAAGALIARFRTLRRCLDRGARPDADGIRAVLDLFPDGWGRRRALSAILRAGAPAELDAAIALIRELPRAADRRWCAMALVSSRDLDADARARLEAEIPAAARR